MSLVRFIDIVILSIIDFIFGLYPFKKPSPEQIHKTMIVAHRGAWDNKNRIENTMDAFYPILEKDIFAVEFDLRWSKDNKPLVHHDPALTRLFKVDHQIAALSLNEIKALCPLIPEFQEVIKLLAKKKHLFIELKSPLTNLQKIFLQDHLKNLKPSDDFHIMSLDFKALEEIDFYPSKSLVSIARFNIKEAYQKTVKNNWGGLTGHYLLLSHSMIMDCHQKGIKVGTGFPKSSKVFYREIHRGVDWIFTNESLKLSLIKEKLN